VAERKEACPCGSGRTSRQCCGTKRRKRSAHQQDERLVFEMLRHAGARWGSAWLEEATFAYFADTGPEMHDADPQLFLPWLVHHWSVEGRPIREWFLEERRARLSPWEIAWLEAQREVVLTVWRVLETQPGVGLRVRHLLGPEETFVQERLGSRQLVPGDSVLARLVAFEDSAVFCGMYPYPLPPRETEVLVSAVCRELRARGLQTVPRERLAAEDTTLGLVLLWRELVAYLEHQAQWELLEELLEEPEGWK
jgi:hypothetical protein